MADGRIHRRSSHYYHEVNYQLGSQTDAPKENPVAQSRTEERDPNTAPPDSMEATTPVTPTTPAPTPTPSGSPMTQRSELHRSQRVRHHPHHLDDCVLTGIRVHA
ncbi:Hypothetical predicted protein [Podarcis lilfordi]|uniref:Uncharacterized protein n=1 Tax=Podarcis lilfordi TaxID=74358 RepID=A0AA35PH71_9SAUR|nr:Hypothetical predicted protein [Podarcis lilfordi]